MAEYITLMGAEEVTRAAGRMQEAAQSMQLSADQIDYRLTQFAKQMDELVARLEAIATAQNPTLDAVERRLF